MSGQQEIQTKRLMVNVEDSKTQTAEVKRCQQHPQTKSVSPVFLSE